MIRAGVLVSFALGIASCSSPCDRVNSRLDACGLLDVPRCTEATVPVDPTCLADCLDAATCTEIATFERDNPGASPDLFTCVSGCERRADAGR